MKAFLLAAGLGTRLRPLTNETPKCLIEINGKPLLSWWVDLLSLHNIKEVLINIHYLPEKVINFISEINKVKFVPFHEKELLGSAGTILRNREFVKNENDFLIAYADNLTNYNLSDMFKFHKLNNSVLTMALYKTDIPKQKGIVQLDNNNTIIDFVEKPISPKSNLANAGLYFCKQDVFDFLDDNSFDIGFDLLPKLINNMSGWVTDDYLIDIGTYEQLKQARDEWNKINNN